MKFHFWKCSTLYDPASQFRPRTHPSDGAWQHKIGPANSQLSQLYQLDMANKHKHIKGIKGIRHKKDKQWICFRKANYIHAPHIQSLSSVDIEFSVKWGSLEMGVRGCTLLCPLSLSIQMMPELEWVGEWDSAEDYRTQCEPVVVPRDPGWITHPEHHYHPHNFDQDHLCYSHCLYRHCYCHDHHHQFACYCPKGSLSGLLTHP